MKAFLLVALLVLVQANELNVEHKHKKHHEECPFSVSNFKYMTNILYQMHNGWVKGMYRLSSDPISTECYGEWLTEDYSYLVDTIKGAYTNKKFPKEDAKILADGFVDDIYRNHHT